MKTIAVFGGTFNPFHIGHEQMLKAVNELEFVDEIFIIPSKIPPHKSVDFLADDASRLDMCKLVASKYAKSRVLDIEINREGKSYTIDTLHSIYEKYNFSKLFLVIGGDMVASFNEWKDYKEILKLSGLIVFSRTTTESEEFNSSIKSLRELGANIIVVDTDIANISSTEIRENISNDKYLSEKLPKEVYDYILENHTYTPIYDIERFKEVLKENLDDYRYRHSLCVAEEAKILAELYGADKTDAFVGGLLHDATKNFSVEEHLKIFDSFDIILDDVTKNSKKLWHAISGALYAKGFLGVCNSDIISSIRYHTSGKPNMSLLEKIIYVADFTSVDRDYPDVDIMRSLSRKSLDQAMIYALKHTINDLNKKGLRVHPDTIDAYNYLINNKGEV